jgi:zinc ribbon protein
MSVSVPAAEPCPDCGAALPAGARYCPECGSDLGAAAVPPDETSVTYEHAEPRWFGIAPPYLLLGVAGGALALALVLVAVGHWPYGLILLGVGALLLAAFIEAAKRRPEEHGLVRSSSQARERARSSVETWRARSAAAAESRRIRNVIAVAESERQALLLELGTAAYRRDGAAEDAARTKLSELEAREWELHGRLQESIREAGERIRRARLPVEETIMVLPTEPTPPPDEGTPPTPAVVPEPYPPPDEGDPPEPARIPEPSPGGPEERTAREERP